MKSVALLTAQLQHTARVDLVMRCYLNSAETTSASVAVEDLMLLVPRTCRFYCYQSLGISFVLYHLLFRSRITDHVWRGDWSLELPCGSSRPLFLLDPVTCSFYSYQGYGYCLRCLILFRSPITDHVCKTSRLSRADALHLRTASSGKRPQAPFVYR